MIIDLKDLLGTEINLSNSTKGMNQREVSNLVESHRLTKVALDYFLKQEITWKEYIEILEAHKVNIDSYLMTIENNLEFLGIIT